MQNDASWGLNDLSKWALLYAITVLFVISILCLYISVSISV